MQALRSDPRKQGWLLTWLAVAALWLAQAASGFLQPLERWWTDRVLSGVTRQISSEIVVVAIDDASLGRLGHWPWSRELHARLVDRLSEAGAGVVIHTVPLVGAEAEDALSQLNRIAATVASDPSLSEHPRLSGILAQSQDLLDADARFARSLAQNGHVLLSVDFATQGTQTPSWPLATFAAAALGVAPAVVRPDEDGAVRRVPLGVAVEGRKLPTLPTWAVLASRQVAPTGWRWRSGQTEATLGAKAIPTDRQGWVRPLWHNPLATTPGFLRLSAAEVLRSESVDRRLAGKLVFIGLSSAGASGIVPLMGDGAALMPVDLAAQTASALLTGQLVQFPVWGPLFEAGLVVGGALYLLLLVPRLSLLSGATCTALGIVSILVCSHLLLAQRLLQLPVMLPVLALCVGHLCGWLARWWDASRAASAVSSLLESATAAGPATRGSTSLTLSPALPHLGRFQIIRELSRGAMGRIYAAHELETLRPVAVKTLALSREFHGEALQEARERFRREATAASRLKHPDIVQIIDAGEDQGLVFIAMELLSGENLDRHARRHDLLPVPEVLETCARIAEALHHAHKLGVVHRDIKPANIMINRAQGMVKITDFGVARVIDAARTRTGVILGSPSYMSPEQLIGRTVDGRADLYSLGVLLFQLLTGHLPFQGSTMGSLIDAVVNQPAPDVRSLRPRLPEAVANIVALALEKRPELRYADCRQMAADLRAVAALWRTATGARAEALSGDWASPSEFVEAMDLGGAARHTSLLTTA